ncbi:DUF3221 domain-containing protein [Rossellomorea marisflavi]|uniref:DUF3221 domain-containing protein n=1 Tax=Rossellomorea marisflavi TaxID=189381 RepID=UPI00345993A6
MKRFMKYLLPVGLFLLVTGCEEMIHEGQPEFVHDGEGSPTMEGIYLKERSILVPIEDFDEEEIDHSFKEFDQDNRSFTYLLFQDDSMAEGIESGAKVRVWCGIIMESSPANAKCSKIEVVEE